MFWWRYRVCQFKQKDWNQFESVDHTLNWSIVEKSFETVHYNYNVTFGILIGSWLYFPGNTFSLKLNALSVTIFTLHHTFPHSCLYLHWSLGDLGTLLSLHIFQLLLIAYSGIAMHSTAQQCTVCLLMHSLLTHAQSAYLCTARLPTRSLLVQYIRTLWTLIFSS